MQKLIIIILNTLNRHFNSENSLILKILIQTKEDAGEKSKHVIFRLPLALMPQEGQVSVLSSLPLVYNNNIFQIEKGRLTKTAFSQSNKPG